MADKIINIVLFLAICVFCFCLFWRVQAAREFEIVGGELFVIFIPAAIIGCKIIRKKGK